MKVLILAFTLLLTPFLYAQDDVRENYPAESENVFEGVSVHFTDKVFSGETKVQIYDAACAYFLSVYPSDSLPIAKNESAIVSECTGTDYIKKIKHTWCQFCDSASSDEISGTNLYITFTEVIQKRCPPDSHPTFVVGEDIDDDGQFDVCYEDERLDECPSGYYKYKANGECQPVNCDSQGDSKNIWASGSVYGNGQGTYCDGSCAHTVAGGQNPDNRSGNISITAVSTGQSCGSGHPDDRWMNEGDDGNCSSTDVGTGTGFLACPPDGNTETPPEEPTEEPPVDLGDEKANENDIPTLIPIEDVCMPGDASCEFKNLKAKIESEGQEQKQLETSLHNKRVEAIEKTTTSLTKSVNDSAQRNSDGLKVVSDAIDSLTKSIEDGSGGGGDSDDGFCDSDGNCSTSVETKTEPSEGLTGFWKTEYEEGLQGIFEEKLINVKQTEFYLLLDQFNPTFSAGTAPVFQFCFDMGFASFGCQSLDIDSRVFPAIRIFILITAVFLCRKILFGG